ncbi:MAG: polymer-forming cytoskeletal protein [Verrucomicrobiales bacterium]
MFRKFHKIKKVNLTCPYCGHVQEEPLMAVSSFCQSCGDHFRIIRGVAVANPGIKVSGIAEIKSYGRGKPEIELPFDWTKVDPGGDNTSEIAEEFWVANPPINRGKSQSLPEPVEGEEEAVGISAGAFFGLVDKEDFDEQTAEDGKFLGNESESSEKLAEGSMEAMIGPSDKKQKMPPNCEPPEQRKKASESGSTFEVRCFRCFHIQQVSRFARSTQCERCCVYISLANYEVKTHKSHTLQTRGDIIVAKRGSLTDCEIACHHLVANGSIDAYVDCSGDATFRKSGVVRGEVFCRRLLIDKHCEVEFPDGVKVQRADINGTLKGNLTCSGSVKISKTGVVEGDVKAIDITIKEGGAVNGETDIDPDTTTELPVKMGTNSSVIS